MIYHYLCVWGGGGGGGDTETLSFVQQSPDELAWRKHISSIITFVAHACS